VIIVALTSPRKVFLDNQLQLHGIFFPQLLYIREENEDPLSNRRLVITRFYKQKM